MQDIMNTSREAAALCFEGGCAWKWAWPLQGPGIYACRVATIRVAPRGPPLSSGDLVSSHQNCRLWGKDSDTWV